MTVAGSRAEEAAEVARGAAQAHPGYELIGYSEVGLPVFELRIRADVLDRKPIDPFAEFVLRSVSDGIDGVDEMAAVLGLEERVLDTTLVSLIASDYLRESADVDSVSITEDGELTLADARQIQVKEASLRVAFDPLIGSVIEPFGEFLPPAELKRSGIREVAVPPALVPELRQLDVGDVERVVRQLGRGREQARDVLALKTMRRFRVFRPALALAYRAEGTNDVVVDVVFSGQASEAHSRALAKHGLRDRLGMVRAGRDRIGERWFGMRKSKVPLDRSAVRNLPPYELPAQLKAAIDTARERLVITSPGLQDATFDGDLVRTLTDLAGRGVSVHVGWGYDEGARAKSDREVRNALDRLTSKSPHFNVRQIDKLDGNWLICDDRFAITTDFRWLSHFGDPSTILGDQRGMLITARDYVNYQADKLIKRLTARPGGGAGRPSGSG